MPLGVSLARSEAETPAPFGRSGIKLLAIALGTLSVALDFIAVNDNSIAFEITSEKEVAT
jgi:hypothetical protein